MSKQMMSLEQASNVIGQVTALDAKMNALLKTLNDEIRKLEFNQQEIKRRLNLEENNILIEQKIKQLQKDVADIKGQRDSKVSVLEGEGWVIPIPAPEIAKGSISM